jgi:uncharacterized protein YjbI with pentapeptide repeats
MGEPPRTPYAPDLADEPVPVVDLGDLTDVKVDALDWANQRSFRLVMHRVELRVCRLTGAELAEAALTDVTFADCRLDLVGMRYAKLERVVFRDCRMGECDFSAASLKDVLFERCELREATFAGARVQRVEIQGCDLAALRGVEALRTVRMPWNDVLANALLFAMAVGIEIID